MFRLLFALFVAVTIGGAVAYAIVQGGFGSLCDSRTWKRYLDGLPYAVALIAILSGVPLLFMYLVASITSTEPLFRWFGWVVLAAIWEALVLASSTPRSFQPFLEMLLAISAGSIVINSLFWLLLGKEDGTRRG